MYQLRKRGKMFLDDYKRFLGTGQLNEKGQSLKEFLEEYNPKAYDNPSNTVDIVVFGYDLVDKIPNINKVLLIKRANHPCIGMYALPGGFVEYKENISTSARRELFEETGVDNIAMEQFAVYGDYDRDPRMRVITTAYVALVPNGSIKPKAGDDAKEADNYTFTCKKVSEENVDGIMYEDFELTFVRDDIRLNANVRKSFYCDRLLKEESYKVLGGDLATDHAAIIAHAYNYVMEKCVCQR